MHSSTFGKGWVGMSACPLVVLACESLHVCTVCIWRCEHARFCVEVFYALYINVHSFIHSFRKFNSSLLKHKEYVRKIKESIKETKLKYAKNVDTLGVVHDNKTEFQIDDQLLSEVMSMNI